MCNEEYVILYPLFNFYPVKGFKCGTSMGKFRGASSSASKRIFNMLKTFNLRGRNSVVKRVTIIKTRVYEGSGDSCGSDKVKSVTDTTKVTNMVMTGAR